MPQDKQIKQENDGEVRIKQEDDDQNEEVQRDQTSAVSQNQQGAHGSIAGAASREHPNAIRDMRNDNAELRDRLEIMEGRADRAEMENLWFRRELGRVEQALDNTQRELHRSNGAYWREREHREELERRLQVPPPPLGSPPPPAGERMEE